MSARSFGKCLSTVAQGVDDASEDGEATGPAAGHRVDGAGARETENYRYATTKCMELLEAYKVKVTKRPGSRIVVDVPSVYQQFLDAPDAAARRRIAERIAGQTLDNWEIQT